MTDWRTATHWYRPIRLTDERRFYDDMQRGWRAVGALPPEESPFDEAIVDMFRPRTMWLLERPSRVLDLFR